MLTDRLPEVRTDRRDRSAAVKQYSLKQILGVWAAAALPMGILAWIVAPWLGGRLGGQAPLGIIPTALLDTFLFARPSRRFESAWMGIIAHSAQTVVVLLVVLGLVTA